MPATPGAPALSIPGTAHTHQSEVMSFEEEQGELVPLVDLAGGKESLAVIISDVLNKTVEAVSTEYEATDHPAPKLPETDSIASPLPPATARSRPGTRASVAGSLMSNSSSVGTEQARDELAGIGGMMGDMVDGVFQSIAGEFGDSVPSTRPGTGAPGPHDSAATPGGTTTPHPMNLESQPQTPAGSAPPTPGPMAPQTSMEGEDSLASSRPGTRAGEADDTQEGQYGSRPSTGKSFDGGGVGTMADAPPAASAEELAAEEERVRQEEEMLRQVQEMREELARVYERDLVTFFDLYLALSQPV